MMKQLLHSTQMQLIVHKQGILLYSWGINRGPMCIYADCLRSVTKILIRLDQLHSVCHKYLWRKRRVEYIYDNVNNYVWLCDYFDQWAFLTSLLGPVCTTTTDGMVTGNVWNKNVNNNDIDLIFLQDPIFARLWHAKYWICD